MISSSLPIQHFKSIDLLSFCFGYIARGGDNLEKIIALGLVEGKAKAWWQNIKWSDGIREITGLDVCTASRHARIEMVGMSTSLQDHNGSDITHKTTTTN